MTSPSRAGKAVILVVSGEATFRRERKEKEKKVYFTQMPIWEVTADNKRADVCCFLSRSTGQERDRLDLQLFSSPHCTCHCSGNRQETLLTSSCCCRSCQVLPSHMQGSGIRVLPKPCPDRHPAHIPTRHSCRKGKLSFALNQPIKAAITWDRRYSRIPLFWRKTTHQARLYIVFKTKAT